MNGCDAKVVITADTAPRGGRATKLKDNVNQALLNNLDPVKCLVVRRTGQEIAWRGDNDYWLHEVAAEVDSDCSPRVTGKRNLVDIVVHSWRDRVRSDRDCSPWAGWWQLPDDSGGCRHN